MLMKVIAEYAHGIGAGVIGQTLFAYNMPESVVLSILLRQPLNPVDINYELPGYRKTQFQVIARCHPKDIEQGHALITAFVEAITIEYESDIAGMHVKYMRPRHDPMVYPLSEGNHLEFAVNFDLVYVIVQ